MTFDYASIATAAAEILAKFGADGTLTRKAAGTYNPATGAATPSETTTAVTACVFPYGDRFIDGTTITTRDRQAFIAAGSGVTEPREGDLFEWGAELFTVQRVKNLGPARTMVLYEAQVRLG